MVYHGIPWFTMVYHGKPWYTMVYHGKPWYIIPHGITMVKPRGITTWSYHGNTSVLVHHGIPWFTMVTMVNHGILYHMVLPW